MDRKKVAEENGKVFNVGKVEFIKIFYIDKNYRSELYANNKIGKTGRLNIGKLISDKQDLPEFVLRWDEGKGELDVDIYVNGKMDNSLWKHADYNGHHSTRIHSGQGSVFELDVSTPNRKIFQGHIRVPVGRKLKLVG